MMARVVGSGLPFGQEIVARLHADGYQVVTGDKATPTLDVLVVNVPVRLSQRRFLDITDTEFHAALQTMVLDVAAAGQAALPLLAQGGRIVHVASRGHLGAWGGAELMAANAGLMGLTRSMALELSDRGIRVNAVAPDFVGEAWDNPAARERVAGAVAFLIGPDSDLVTGETMLLDTARSLRMSESRGR